MEANLYIPNISIYFLRYDIEDDELEIYAENLIRQVVMNMMIV